jgi:hypothetical protein
MWLLWLVRFRGQFIKLLKCMYEEVLPELGKSKEADVQVCRARRGVRQVC